METITLLSLLCCIGIISAYNGGQETEAENIEDTGKCYVNGPIKSDNICSQCFCRNNRKTCTRQSCSQPVPRGCEEVKVPGKCCPEIRCPDASGNGNYDQQVDKSDKIIENDESYCTGNGPIVSSNPCSLCFCRNNKKSCARKSCKQAVPRGCEEVSVPEKCCPEIRCPETSPPEQETELDNNYGRDSGTPRNDPENPGQCIGEGQIPNVNPCNKCSCRNGRKICPAWNCPNRPSGPNCKFVRNPDQCCPVEKCDTMTGGGGPPTSGSNNYEQNEDTVPISQITGCYKDGPITTKDPCERCSCYKGSRRCTKMGPCPDVQPGCFATNNPGQCCPKIECENSYDIIKKY